MKKYIPLIILALLIVTVLNCRQHEIMDELESPIIQKPENSQFTFQKFQDTIRKKINPTTDPPVKDTHDWKTATNNP